MKDQNKGGLEAVVSKESPMQKKPAKNRFLVYAGQLPKFMVTAVAGIGLAASLYFGGMSAYHAIDEYLSVDESQVAAAKSNEEPSPYSGSMIYCMIFIMCAIGGSAFGYAMISSVKEAKSKIEEDEEKKNS